MDCKTIFRDCNKTATCIDTNILNSGVNLSQLDYYSQGAMFSINPTTNQNLVGQISSAPQSIQYMDLPNKSILFDTVRLIIPSIITQSEPLKVEVGIYEVKQTDGSLVIGDVTTYSNNSKLIYKTSKTFEQIDSSGQLRDLGIVNIKFDEDVIINNTSGVYYFIEIAFFGINNPTVDGFIQGHTSNNFISGYSWINNPTALPPIDNTLPDTLSDINNISTDTPRPYYLLYKDYYS